MSPAYNVVNNFDNETNHEEQVHDDVVIVPKSKVSLLESFLVWTRALEAPKEARGAEVPHGVGDDEDQHEELDDVDKRGGGFRDVADNQGDEDDVGEGGVDPTVQRDAPLFAEPGRGVASVARVEYIAQKRKFDQYGNCIFKAIFGSIITFPYPCKILTPACSRPG